MDYLSRKYSYSVIIQAAYSTNITILYLRYLLNIELLTVTYTLY